MIFLQKLMQALKILFSGSFSYHKEVFLMTGWVVLELESKTNSYSFSKIQTTNIKFYVCKRNYQSCFV